MRVTDAERLRHMLDAAAEALTFVEDKTREELRTSRLLVLALTRQLEIIGEAAGRVSPGCRECIPGIPWATVVGIRNRLIHAYFDVDLDVVWSTVTADLPELVRVLREVVPDEK